MIGYTITPIQTRADALGAYRESARAIAQQLYDSTGRILIGYRDSPWGTEAVIFGTRAGLNHWANAQTFDKDVRYATGFDFGATSSPTFEVMR